MPPPSMVPLVLVVVAVVVEVVQFVAVLVLVTLSYCSSVARWRHAEKIRSCKTNKAVVPAKMSARFLSHSQLRMEGKID